MKSASKRSRARETSALPLASRGVLCVQDLNYLYMRHQVSLMRAGAANCAPSRVSHNLLARAYGRRIDVLRAEIGALDVVPV